VPIYMPSPSMLVNISFILILTFYNLDRRYLNLIKDNRLHIELIN